MNRFFLPALCSLLIPLGTSASPLGPDAETARQELIAYVDTLEQTNVELDNVVDPAKFDQLRVAIGRLEEVPLSIISDGLSGVQTQGPVPDTIVFPAPDILPICETTTPLEGYVFFEVAVLLNEILAPLKWACLQSELGENNAALCVGPSSAAALANMLFLEATICLNAQRTGYQTASFETQGNIARHLNDYIDSTVSSRASQSSLGDLQSGLNQELEDLGTLANSVAADVSDLSADLQDTSNSIAALASATIDMTSISEGVRLKTLVTQAEAEEIDDLAADTQQRLATIRSNTIAINASVQTLETLINELNTAAGNEIERELDASVGRAMADPDFNIVRYKLPASMNGELERSREVLIRAILAFDSIGSDTQQARQYLAMGDNQFNAGRYLTAYDHFSTAYQMLLAQSSGPRGEEQ